MPNPKLYRTTAANPEAGWLNIRSSKILQLGLGDEILTKRESGWSISSIANLVSLDKFTVSHFLKNWEALPPELQKEYREKMRQDNVWDLTARIQDLFETIQEKMGQMEANPMLHREYVAEQRMLLQLAASIIEKAQKLELQKTVVSIMLEEIAKEDKALRDRILDRVRTIKEAQYLLGASPGRPRQVAAVEVEAEEEK